MDCDKGLGHGKTYGRLKDKQCKSDSSKQDSSMWDSAESDTESLAQERAYQQALQERIGCNNDTIVTPKEDMGRLWQEEEDEDSPHVYDSLEVAAHRSDERSSRQSSVEVHDAHQMNGNEVSRPYRQVSSDDSYADLRYDPNWKTNLTGAWQFAETSTSLSPEEGSQNANEKSEGSHTEKEDHSTRVGYRYIIARSPALAENMRPDMTANQFESQHPLESYHLHPEEDQPTREVPQRLHVPHHHAAGDRLSDSPHLRTDMPSERGPNMTSHRKVQAKRVEPNRTGADQNPSSSPELEDHYREIHDKYARECQMYYEEEQGQTETASEKQSKSSSKQKSPQRRSNRKPEKTREDIIERNKMTLGINAVKQGGSYLKAHSQKEGKSDALHQVTDTTEEITTAGSQEGSLEDHSDPELRWLQKTQQLKVTQFSEEKKAQRRGNPSEKRPVAQGGKARQKDCLSPPTPKPAARPQPNPPPQRYPSPPPQLLLRDTDSHFSSTAQHPQSQRDPLTHPPPAVHLNINLNATPASLPFLHQGGQGAVITLNSSRGPQTFEPTADYSNSLFFANDLSGALPVSCGGQGQMVMLVSQQPALPPSIPGPGSRPRLGHPGRPSLSQGSRGVMNTEPHVWHQNTPARWQNCTSPRLTATQWQSPALHNQEQRSGEERGGVLPPDESHSYRPAAPTTQPQQSDSHTVLPPIGTSMTGHPKLSPGASSQQMNPIQRSTSDGYLAQMEKQKQLKEKVSYKAYTLKDYKRLKQDVKLGGLGPDNNEITVEKMRRQRLYSNVIREQNKKISRIPFLPTRNPTESDRTDEVPRKKALEYAKSIARPMAPTKPLPKPRGTKGAELVFSERTADLEGLDLSQLATLELLRKRHEEEKQVVAHFKAIHAV